MRTRLLLEGWHKYSLGHTLVIGQTWLRLPGLGWQPLHRESPLRQQPDGVLLTIMFIYREAPQMLQHFQRVLQLIHFMFSYGATATSTLTIAAGKTLTINNGLTGGSTLHGSPYADPIKANIVMEMAHPDLLLVLPVAWLY